MNTIKRNSLYLGMVLAGLAGNSFAAANLTLEEVFVSAQKTTESLQDVPISVIALASDSLGNFKFRNTQEIAAQAPNVQMLGSNGDAQLVLGMRGITQSDYSPNGTGAVALYVDEVYMGATPLASSVQLFDVERIEMLLGPQGTLYGKNATGGAVNVMTNVPQMDDTSGYLDIGLGNYGYKTMAGAIDTLLSDNWGVRLAFTNSENDGLVDNKQSGADDPSQIKESGVRLSLAYQGDDLDAILRVTKNRTRANHSGILLLEADGGVENGGVGLGSTGYGRGDLDFHETESNRVEEKKFDLESVNLTLRGFK